MLKEKQETMRVLSFAEIHDMNRENTQVDNQLEQMEFEVLKTGDFYDRRYGKFKVTEQLMDDLIRNFEEDALEIDVALDVNHDPEKGAYAWLASLRRQGGRLMATFKDITEDGQKILREKIYKYFSVEFAPHEKVEGGKKKTIRNVLKGIALTNRPVIKGMRPTFLCESNLFNEHFNMNVLIKLADDLLSRESVTKEDAAFLRGQFEESSEEEKPEGLEEKVGEVEAKAVEAEAEAPEAEEAAPEAVVEEVEAEVEAEAEAEEPEAVEASEMNIKLAEATSEIERLKASEHKRLVSDRVAELTLSEDNKVGFTKKFAGSVEGFVTTLSEEQYASFQALIGNVVNADMLLSESGSAAAVDLGIEQTFEEKVVSRAETILSEGTAKTIDEAQKMAASELK